MLVQHLTSFSHNRPYRNTDDIKVETVNFFKFLEIQSGHLTVKIPNTPLTCRVTCSDRIAIFDLLEGEKLLFVNVKEKSCYLSTFAIFLTIKKRKP